MYITKTITITVRPTADDWQLYDRQRLGGMLNYYYRAAA